MPPYSSDSKLTRLLSKQDAIYLLELVQECLGCNTKEGLKELVNSLQYLIPFDHALCGFARVDEKGMSATFDTTNVSYPDKWLEHYFSKEYFKFDPVVKENFTNFKMQYWQDTYADYGPPKEFVSEAEDFGLLKGYTHGRIRRLCKCSEEIGEHRTMNVFYAAFCDDSSCRYDSTIRCRVKDSS